MNDGSPTLSILYGKLVDLRADVDRLRRYYHDTVEPTEATPYFDHGAEYEGWSITSRDGTVASCTARSTPARRRRRVCICS
jgi:hypothetical protein